MGLSSLKKLPLDEITTISDTFQHLDFLEELELKENGGLFKLDPNHSPLSSALYYLPSNTFRKPLTLYYSPLSSALYYLPSSTFRKLLTSYYSALSSALYYLPSNTFRKPLTLYYSALSSALYYLPSYTFRKL